MSEESTTEVICRTQSHFEGSESFRNEADRITNALILPREVFEGLGIKPYNYVRAAPVEASQERGTETGAVLYTIPFSDDHPADEYQETVEDGKRVYEACLRTTLQAKIGSDMQSSTLRVRIGSIDGIGSHQLNVGRHPAYEPEPLPIHCYINPEKREELNFSEEEPVELYNPETGGRIGLKLKDMDWQDTETVGISDEVIRQLDYSDYEEEKVDGNISLRTPEPVYASYSEPIRTHLGKWLVDYSRVHLRVRPGEPKDEDRGIARVTQDDMQLLGVEPGDEIEIHWNNQSTNVRCFLPDGPGVRNSRETGGEELSSGTIMLPTTACDAVDVAIDDVVSVRRSTSYIMKKRIVKSIFSIIGAIVGSAQLIRIASIKFASVVGVSAICVFVVVALWASFWPERQKCW